MKIGILIDTLNVGGVEKIAIKQVQSLRKRNEDASLVILRKNEIDNSLKKEIQSIPVVYLDERLPKILKYSFKFPLFNFFSSFHLSYPVFLPVFLKRGEFDYFIAHGTYTCFSSIVFKYLNKISYSAFIWDPASYILQSVYKDKANGVIFFFMFNTALFFDRLILRTADSILVGGDAHSKFFKSINPNVTIFKIPPSVNPIRRQIQKKDYLLLLTAWKRGKNPEYIFELLQKLPKLTILLVGKWQDRGYLREFKENVKSFNMESNIKVVGAVTENQLSKYLSEAAVLLQINDDRGFGMPALEAAGHGTTFIIPKGQGVCELFEDKKDGYFIKEKDTKRIVNLLDYLFSDKKRYISMGKMALEKVQESYTWSDHAKNLINVVEKYK